jgi:hypothetical protein
MLELLMRLVLQLNLQQQVSGHLPQRDCSEQASSSVGNK